jgi:hypothetical protein
MDMSRQQRLEFSAEPGVNGDVALVHRDAEAAHCGLVRGGQAATNLPVAPGRRRRQRKRGAAAGDWRTAAPNPSAELGSKIFLKTTNTRKVFLPTSEPFRFEKFKKYFHKFKNLKTNLYNDVTHMYEKS